MYKINGVDISEILESPANRESSDLGLTGFNIGSAPITYAAYNPLYHPFTVDTGLSNYYVNSSTQNKGYIPKGYAPLAIPRYILDFIGEKPITYNYHYIKMLHNHKAEIGIQYTNSYSPIKTIDVPETFILCIQGSGGGGAGGTKNDNAMGGGCGAVLVLNVKYTPGITIFMELGAGGKGGAPNESGQSGKYTEIYCGNTIGTADYVASITGGYNGYISSSNKPIYAPLTIPSTNIKYCAFSECVINPALRTTGYMKIDGNDVLAINKSVQNYRPRIWDRYSGMWVNGPVFNYIPGCYYGAYNTASEQPYKWEMSLQTYRNLLPVVSSGNSIEYSRIPTSANLQIEYGPNEGSYNYRQKGASYNGINSVLGLGGKHGASVDYFALGTYADGQAGKDGIRGAGGGAGGHGYAAWGKDAEGGDGGNASFAIYF